MAHLVRPGIKRHVEFMCGLELTLGIVSNQPFLNLMTEAAAAAAKMLQSCPTLCDPIDGNPPVPEILLSLTYTPVIRLKFCIYFLIPKKAFVKDLCFHSS